MTIDHYEALIDSPFLRWFDLNERPALVEIVSVKQEELTLGGGAKRRCPVMTFRQLQGSIETVKPLVINRTNLDTLAEILGPQPSKWIGKAVVLFESMTDFRKERVKCIRIRARKPPKQTTADATTDHEVHDQ
jgi:hypothetical protein